MKYSGCFVGFIIDITHYVCERAVLIRMKSREVFIDPIYTSTYWEQILAVGVSAGFNNKIVSSCTLSISYSFLRFGQYPSKNNILSYIGLWLVCVCLIGGHRKDNNAM